MSSLGVRGAVDIFPVELGIPSCKILLVTEHQCKPFHKNLFISCGIEMLRDSESSLSLSFHNRLQSIDR